MVVFYPPPEDWFNPPQADLRGLLVLYPTIYFSGMNAWHYLRIEPFDLGYISLYKMHNTR